jgi:hypothetical protein
MKIRDRYKINKEAKTGTEIICPSCGHVFKKTSYQQVFCKTKTGTTCKDKYWNTVTPTKRNNVTRISPASQRYMAERQAERMYNTVHGVYGGFHPFEGLNDDDYKNH